MRPTAVWVGVLAALALASAAPAKNEGKIAVRGEWRLGYGLSPTDPLLKLMRDNPEIELREWSGLPLPYTAFRAPLMMSIAGDTAPDVYLAYWHAIRNDIKQGFAYPLNEWIGDDKNGNGQIDLDEAKWPGWKDVPPLWRQVATVNGKVYGLPYPNFVHWAVVYRIDMVRRAGLDPNKPPKTWDEFLYWCQKLTDPGKRVAGAKTQAGQRGFCIDNTGTLWIAWVQSAGGSPVVQERTSPKTGKTYAFPMEETVFRAPDTGEDLSGVPSDWRSAAASDAAMKATAFRHRLRWQKWIKDPETGEPINLTDKQAKAGRVEVGNRTVSFGPKDVIVGAIRVQSDQPGQSSQDLLGRGEVAMIHLQFDDLAYYQAFNVNPELMGAFPIPAGPGGKPVVQHYRHYNSMSEGVGRRPKRERDAVWKVLVTKASTATYEDTVRQLVLSGKARFVNPQDLKRFGFSDYIREVPSSLRQLYADLDSGACLGKTEPFMGYWDVMNMAVANNALTLVTSDSGEDFDYKSALRDVERSCNTGAMFERKPAELARYRPIAWVVFSVVAALVLLFVGLIVKTNFAAHSKTAPRAVRRPYLPWLLLAPALLLVGLWGYYPLVRGLVMAFQDYRIAGDSKSVGLDNFINVLLNPDFYVYILQTLKFVALTMLLVFTAPILLSVLLSEVPRGKVFWRSVFFLPQLTSGLVVVLLWKLIYNPTETGLLNQVVMWFENLFGVTPRAIDWLGNPSTAMVATIIPTVWATMGISSLIYLAAMKGIPEELYEAADIAGAGIWAKLRYITIPQLMPLILITFVGTFIGTFQSMGNIFLLTFGGPGKETMVLSLAIWIEAYANLRFSVATSMAWVMGSGLIGFAYLQIRMLRKVEFRRVEGW
jgi:ABC-type sugar transport system permease subunit/ABC-type glycerol-3-phosphate transport system substrate-binding protein